MVKPLNSETLLKIDMGFGQRFNSELVYSDEGNFIYFSDPDRNAYISIDQDLFKRLVDRFSRLTEE